jgi:Cysteine rich repeat
MRNMRRMILALLAMGTASSASAQTPADDVTAAMQGELAANVIEGCESELTEYCSSVTPGEARILACLYAHEDKLSQQCGFALYDSAVRLERAINTITYVASSCQSELQSMCADVEAGDGRIAQGLKDNHDELSQTCSRALSEVGLE